MGWIGSAVQLVAPKRLPGFSFIQLSWVPNIYLIRNTLLLVPSHFLDIILFQSWPVWGGWGDPKILKMCLRNIWMVPLIIIAWCCTSCRILSWHSWCGWSNWKTRKVIHFMLNFQFWCLISTGNHKLIVIIFSTFDWVVIRCEHCTFFEREKVDIAGFCMLRNFMIVIKFIYSERATKFCEIFHLLLTVCTHSY